MLTNNDIMKKLRVALKLRDTDILEILKAAGLELSPSELSAFFRREGHPHYRPCGDQVVRRFLDGLVIRNRGQKDSGKGYPPPRRVPLPPMEPVRPLMVRRKTHEAK